MLLMVSGLLVSRMFLSMGIILFGVNALWNVHPRRWLQHKWWLTGATWILLYALSWFWSDDKESWNALLQVKLPILLLPLAFSFLPRFTDRQLLIFTVATGVMLFAGACYSLSFLVFNYEFYIREYNVSHIIPTPVYGEYICFSLTISLFIAWCIYMWPRLKPPSVKVIMAFILLFLAVYVHILASKSGLIALYIFLGGLGVYYTVAKRSIYGIIIIVALPVLLGLGIKYIPTLHERKVHIVYTYYRFLSHDKTGNLGDLSRLMSYDLSFKLIGEHPVAGVGVGDMLDEMKKGYARWYPEVKDEHSMLIPHNQFLTAGLGIGIPGLIIFIFWVFMPLRRLGRNRESFYFFIIWLALFVQLMIEPFLEAQFGLFVYIFFILLLRHILPSKGGEERTGRLS